MPGVPVSPQAQSQASPAAIENAARQFESLLIAQLLRSVREGDAEGWLGAGEDPASSSAVELAEEQFAAALSAQGGLGLAGLVVKGLAGK